MNIVKLLTVAGAANWLLAVGGAAQAATAPDAGDYTALPAGTAMSLVYAEYLRGDQIYANGSKVALPSDLDLNIKLGVYREIHYLNVGGFRIDPQFIIPYGRQSIGLSGQRSRGIGDVVFGGTVWTIADMARGEHLGYSVFVTAPTGADKEKGFAISDNRWAADLQVGYIRKLTTSWSLDLIGQAEVYQDRRDTGAVKNPLLRAFTHLRYHLTDATHIAGSLRYAAGAKETLNGATLSSRKSDTNAALTWASFVTREMQLQAQISQDLHVDSGPKLHTLALRALFLY